MEGPVRLDHIVIVAGFAVLVAMTVYNLQAASLPYVR